MRLRGHRAPEPAEPPVLRSAVAAVLRRLDGPAEVLLMTRAEHPADPWSGHVALPGGRQELGDANLLETAVRETREEVGIDLLADAELLCRLASIQARARGRRIPMDVTPFAFRLAGGARPTPGAEASEVFWFPLARAAAGAFDAELPYEHEGAVHRLPCWRFEGRTVWGLTFRMLTGLIEVVRAR